MQSTHQLAIRSQEVETTFMSGMSTGTPKATPVWEYFDYDEASNNSVCKIETSLNVRIK